MAFGSPMAPNLLAIDQDTTRALAMRNLASLDGAEPQDSAPAKRGKGTARSAVEGAHAVRETC